MRLVKSSLEFLVQQLGPRDRFALVSYSTSARVEVSLTSMSSEGKAWAIAAISSMQAEGGTNLGDGVMTSLRLLGAEASAAHAKLERADEAVAAPANRAAW